MLGNKSGNTRLWITTAALIWSFFSAPAAYGAVTVTARADRSQLTVYERLSYTIEIEYDSRVSLDPKPPEFTGFRLMGAPRTSSQYSWVNGVVSNTQTFSYILEAREAGRYTFKPARVEVNGTWFQSDPVTVDVLKPESLPSTGNPTGSQAQIEAADRHESLFIEAVVDKETPYLGEAVRISYHVFTRVNIRDFRIQEEPDYQGFWVENVDLPKQPVLNTRTIQGIEYGEARLHEVIVYPTVSGDLLVPPLIMAFQIQDQRQDPFDNFFNSPFRSNIFGTRQEIRSSRTKTIHVKPLPDVGKPEGFSGAAGAFKLESSIKNPSVKTGEAITINVTLSGDHGLKTIGTPLAPELPDFKVFEPKADEVIPDPETPNWNRRSFEYIIVPHKVGEFTIPGFTFTCFDTGKGEYVTLRTEGTSVSVMSGPGGEMPVAYSAAGGEVKLLNLNERYIKTTAILDHQVVPYRQSWFGLMMILPVIIVPIVLFIDSRRRRLEGDTVFAREVRARSKSGKRFAEARRAWNDQDFNRALDAAAAGFARYLADRLGLPTGGITIGITIRELTARSVANPHIESIREYWEQLETARYGPVEATSESTEDLIRRGQELVDKLEKVRMSLKKRGNQHSKAVDL